MGKMWLLQLALQLALAVRSVYGDELFTLQERFSDKYGWLSWVE